MITDDKKRWSTIDTVSFIDSTRLSDIFVKYNIEDMFKFRFGLCFFFFLLIWAFSGVTFVICPPGLFFFRAIKLLC